MAIASPTTEITAHPAATAKEDAETAAAALGAAIPVANTTAHGTANADAASTAAPEAQATAGKATGAPAAVAAGAPIRAAAAGHS